MIRSLALVFAACATLALPTAAEVLESSEFGFEVQTVLRFDANTDRVYEALTAEIDQWWSPDHTWSGDAANLYLEARAGGIFGENLPSGGSAQHLVVLYADPGVMLRMGGGLGPLQGMAVQGVMTFTLQSDGASGTELTLTYAVAGPASQGLAGPVDGVLAGQMERLADHLAR